MRAVVGPRSCSCLVRLFKTDSRVVIERGEPLLRHQFDLLGYIPEVSRPSAKALYNKLDTSNPLGFPGASLAVAKKPGAFDQSKLKINDLACLWKQENPDKVILVRVGDFYETWGIDAVMLVEHAGLNPMGDSCRAGCPKTNIQQTLNSLTDAGLSVAVYEEANSVGSRSKRLKKERYLAQVVTPGRPVYLHDVCLVEGELPYRVARPYAALRCTKDGCSLAFMWIDSREIRIVENVTEEAVSSLIESVGGIADPVWVALEGVTGSKFESCLPARIRRLPPNLPFPAFLTAVRSELCKELAINNSFSISERTISCEPNCMQPLHATTAQFLGLNSSPGSADLVRNMLPSSAPFFSVLFLRNWLLSPPPRDITDSMLRLVTRVRDLRDPLPQFRVVPVDKLVRLLETRNGNLNFFSDLFSSCDAFLKTPATLLQSPDLLRVVLHSAGIPRTSIDCLLERAGELKTRIARTMMVGYSEREASEGEGCKKSVSEALSRFISLKESQFRDVVKCDYTDLDIAREKLITSVQKCLISPEKSLKYDQVSDVLYVKDVDVALRPDFRKRLVPEDKARKRHTCDRILKAEQEYRESVVKAREKAKSEIEKLCVEISSEKKVMESLIFFSHWAVVISTVSLHVENSLRRAWTIPTIVEDGCSRLESLWPYWLQLDAPAVPNSITLTSGHTSVLTAPNMSGKSTLIRSIAAVVLLGNSGFMVPAREAVVNKISDLLVVSPSGDRPSENISAFAAEADAMSSAIRHSSTGRNVLLLVDEFGRGTSGNDATALSSAVIQFLQKRDNVACIWATHLHELFSHDAVNVSWVQMEGYKLVGGQCTDSKGIEIAKERGFPAEIIQVAKEIRGDIASVQIEATGDSGIRNFLDEIRLPGGEPPEVFVLSPGTSAPPYLQARSVVYILKLSNGSFYIGETDNLSQRLAAHQRRFGKKVEEIQIIQQPDKTQARALETALIRSFMNQSIPVVSIQDGFHQNRISTVV